MALPSSSFVLEYSGLGIAESQPERVKNQARVLTVLVVLANYFAAVCHVAAWENGVETRFDRFKRACVGVILVLLLWGLWARVRFASSRLMEQRRGGIGGGAGFDFGLEYCEEDDVVAEEGDRFCWV